MHCAVYVPVVASCALGLAARWLARHLPPGAATVLLAVCGVLAAQRHWSPSAVAAVTPVPAAVPAAAVVLGCLCAATGARGARAHLRAVVAARDLCRRAGGRRGGLVVVEDGVEAFAVPASGGRVVVSRPLLDALPAGERRALLAHVRAHLAGLLDPGSAPAARPSVALGAGSTDVVARVEVLHRAVLVTDAGPAHQTPHQPASH